MAMTSGSPKASNSEPPGAENWGAVDSAIRERRRELKMPAAVLARETGLSEATIRCIGRPDGGHRVNALVAISAVLRWRYDHLTNILHGHPERNTRARRSTEANIKQLLEGEVVLLKDELFLLKETIGAVGQKIDAHRAGLSQDQARDARETGPKPEAISDLPMLNDIEADYSPQYVKLARSIRDKIKSGELSRSTILLAANLVAEYRVSAQVAYAALDMLAANRYIARPHGARFYRVAWDTNHPHEQA